MDIIEALKMQIGVRVSFDDKWLAWGDDSWVVYQRPYHAKKTKTICRTTNESEAVITLMED